MGEDIRYEVIELNLQRLAILSKATSLWEKPDIKRRLKKFFTSENRKDPNRKQKKTQRKKWYKLTKEVLKQLEPSILPPVLQNELIHVVTEMGLKIYKWYEQVKNENQLEYGERGHLLDYIDKIYWTHYGTIDEVKILKSFWIGNPKLNICKVYNSACNNVLEEYINSLWEKIPITSKRKYCEDLYKRVSGQHLLVYWKCHRDGDKPRLIRYLERYNFLYDRHDSVEEKMFILSVYKGYIEATKYFWSKFNEEEKDKNMVRGTSIAIRRHNFEHEKQYKREKYVEICTFLIKAHKKELFEGEFLKCLLKMFLSVWPWQEFFMSTLDEMWPYLQEDGDTGGYILRVIVSEMNKRYKLGCPVENSKYQNILHVVWRKMSSQLKSRIAQKHLSKGLICDLISMEDMSSLQLIVNAPEVIENKNEIIDFGAEKYADLVKKDKYESLNEFIRQMLFTDEEKKLFKQKISIWNYFIKRKQYQLADKLLDWQCNTEEEKKFLKKKMNLSGLYREFMRKDQCKLANKLLDWQFITEEDKRNCKIDLRSTQFLSHHIYELWTSREIDVEEVEEKSLRFLKWFLESEETVTWFRKNKLINDELKEVLFYKFIRRNRFEIIEDFLAWCLLSEVEIKNIKQEIVDRTIMQERNLMNKWFPDTVQRFVEWAFDQEKERLDFIKQLMMSDDGISLCDALIHESYVASDKPRLTFEEKLDKFNKFIDFWLRPVEHLDKVKSQLSSREYSFSCKNEQRKDRKIFIGLLNDLERDMM